MKKKHLILFSISGSFFPVAVAIILTLLMNRPLQNAESAFLYIDADDTQDSVYAKLERNLNASSLTGLKTLASTAGYKVRPGAYRFDKQIRTLELYKDLRNGHQTPVNLIVPGSRTLEQLARNVSLRIMADSASLSALFNDTTWYPSGYTRATLPALFIPNTYQVYWNITPKAFIGRMKKEHDRFWTAERLEKAKAAGLTPTEVSILASIVEEETANRAERPTVAGLYLNRLRIGMPLQADPTIKFALQDFGLKRILFKHLEVESPYNTYKHAGLPPGPIRIPSINAIESVLNYTHHKYLYMCAKEDFSGTHNFSTNLAQHAANARRYQAALNRLR